MKEKILEILKANVELISGDDYTNESFIHSRNFNYIAEKIVKLFAIHDVMVPVCDIKSTAHCYYSNKFKYASCTWGFLHKYQRY